MAVVGKLKNSYFVNNKIYLRISAFQSKITILRFVCIETID